MKNKNLINSTFKKDDCVFLLKDLSNEIKEISIEEKEKLINKGINYSEMISKEYPVTDEINRIFKELLNNNSSKIANYIGIISEQIYNKSKENSIIISLARAGSPFGALVKRYFKFKYNLNIPHYSISIIRGKGIDENALLYIQKEHPHGIITFLDGWTGKGSITKELKKSINIYNDKYKTQVSSDLAVLADPAKLSAIYGTRKDICIPNACLNSTVSGLVSRTIHNDKYISLNDFHGAKIFYDLKKQDYTNYFLDEIEKNFNKNIINNEIKNEDNSDYVNKVLLQLKNDFDVLDSNKIKLSIGESSRALLRRNPKIMLVKNIKNKDLQFLLYLVKQKNVEVKKYDTFDYECITLLN